MQAGVAHNQIRNMVVSGDQTHFEVRPNAFDLALKSFKGFRLDGKRVSARSAL